MFHLKFFFIVVILLSCLNFSNQTGNELKSRKKRQTVGSLLGKRPLPPRKNKPPPGLVPPIELGPGEVEERPPGWKCVKNMRATLNWKTFRSPGYPKFESGQIQCTWIVEAPVGMQVKLAFRDLDLFGLKGACNKQFVQLIDVKVGKSQGRFCGNNAPGDYVSKENFLRLDLQGDKTVKTYRGFSVSVIAVKDYAGYRSTRTYPSPVAYDSNPGGRVNLQSFVSKNEPATPSPIKINKRKLVYESDLPKTTPSSVQQGQPASTLQGGWIANGGLANAFKPQTSRRPALVQNTRGPPTPAPGRGAKFIPVTKKSTSNNNNPSEGLEEGQSERYIDPSTLHNSNFDTEIIIPGSQKKGLSMMNLIIIIASCSAFVIIILFVLGCWWFRRKKKQYRKEKKANATTTNVNDNKNTQDAITMKEMEARQTVLPGMVHQNQTQRMPSMGHQQGNYPPSQQGYHPPPTQQHPQFNGHSQNMPPTQSRRHMSRNASNHMPHTNSMYQHYQKAEFLGSKTQNNRQTWHGDNNDQQQMMRTSSGRPLPTVPAHNKPQGHINEEYVSGSEDQGAQPATVMRREYSAWELEKMKEDRKSKLVLGS